MHLNRKYIQRHKKRREFSACGSKKRLVDCQYLHIPVSVTIFLFVVGMFYCQNFFRVSNISDLPKIKALCSSEQEIDPPV